MPRVAKDWWHQVMEAAYVDDLDFWSCSLEDLTRLMQQLSPHFAAQFELIVNAAKTEWKVLSNRWHEATQYKKLGTMVDAVKDVGYRIHKAAEALSLSHRTWQSHREDGPYHDVVENYTES